jgi:hypothetical protein
VVSPEDQSQLDKELSRIVRHSRRYLWYSHAAEAVVIIALAVVVTILAREVSSLSQQATQQSQVAEVRARSAAESVLVGSCPFWRDLGSVRPVMPLTKFGTQILADSRNAFLASRCPGALPPAPAALLAAVAKYHVPLHG